MLVEDEEARHGNDRFEGYNVDLIRYISEVLKFNYTIHIVKDRSYGSYNEKNDTWNGMIGELLSQVRIISKLHQISNNFRVCAQWKPPEKCFKICQK